MLTFLFFTYYTTDITSEMTSGAPDIPIRTFEDVVHYGYRVVTYSPYYERILKSAKPGSAMNYVYNNHFKMNQGFRGEISEEVVGDPKALFYGPKAVRRNSRFNLRLFRQTFPLNMDDAVYQSNTLGLQKDSEFLQLFNHYIMKAYETGFFKRLFRKYYINLFIKENYEMVEPLPLGFNNVMFLFICLATGVCLSIIMVLLELTLITVKKLPKHRKWAASTRIREERERVDRQP